MRVSVAGIDSHSEIGARVILRRIQSAAARVCGPAPILLDRIRLYEPCVRDVTERTVAGLNNPVLTAMMSNEAPARLASAK